MKSTRRNAMFGLTSLLLSACGSRLPTYRGPDVTRVVVFKNDRRMYLLHGNRALKSYDVDLGFAPVGDKRMAGDGKTPEGRYVIDRRNPRSSFHLSLGIDYPRPHDIAEAQRLGKEPGGDIFIHGRGNLYTALRKDWTWGCIAVTNDEMDEIYAMVKTGTEISIHK